MNDYYKDFDKYSLCEDDRSMIVEALSKKHLNKLTDFEDRITAIKCEAEKYWIDLVLSIICKKSNYKGMVNIDFANSLKKTLSKTTVLDHIPFRNLENALSIKSSKCEKYYFFRDYPFTELRNEAKFELVITVNAYHSLQEVGEHNFYDPIENSEKPLLFE